MPQSSQAQAERQPASVQPATPFFEGLCNQFKEESISPALITASCEAMVNTLQAARHNYQQLSPQAYRQWCDAEIERIQAVATEAADS